MSCDRGVLSTVVVIAIIAALSPTASAMLHPGLGRFVQRDRAGYVDGANLQIYAHAAPLRVRDPSGFCGWERPNIKCCVIGEFKYAWGPPDIDLANGGVSQPFAIQLPTFDDRSPCAAC